MSRDKRISIVVVVLLLGAAIVSSLYVLIPFDAMACDENSEEVAYARSLTDDRLEQLYREVVNIASSSDHLHRVRFDSEAAPPELSDIEYVDIIVDGIRARMLLKGCFDHMIILSFMGIYREEPEAIVLSWGEGPRFTEQRLWPN